MNRNRNSEQGIELEKNSTGGGPGVNDELSRPRREFLSNSTGLAMAGAIGGLAGSRPLSAHAAAGASATSSPMFTSAPGKPRRIIIDTDPGIDDAMAIFLALRSPELKVEAITPVAGNVPLELTLPNALRLVEIAGRTDVPVAAGGGGGGGGRGGGGGARGRGGGAGR